MYFSMLPLVLLPLFGSVGASFGGNLNYRSPSHNHPSLGISLKKVARRDLGAALAPASEVNFTHGVASGDPFFDSVILWTRASPMMDDDKSNVTVSGYVPLYDHSTESYVNMSTSPVCVEWMVGSTKNETHVTGSIVTHGTAYTTSDIDYTIKVEASGLKPFTVYYYQFAVCGSQTISVVGRTKTAPAPYDYLSKVSLAVFSCSNFPFGYFNAYGNSARKDDVDYVVHLGDYIYEYKNGAYGNGTSIDRIPLPDRQIYTLYDYRKRYATYRTDQDLLLSHQQFAWIPVWDDHEVADNTWKSGSSSMNNSEDSFVQDGGVSVDQRKANAVRAYFEFMPIRQVDMDDNLRIWRSFRLGDIVDLILLDTRQYDRSITDLYSNTDYVKMISNDSGRSMMGSAQEKWFYNRLSESAERGATWRIIGSQTVFSRVNMSAAFGNVFPENLDSWDGYLSNRNRTLHHLYSNNINNNLVIAGDSHQNWVSDLVWLNDTSGTGEYDASTGAGSIGVEFAGTAVSSPSPFGQTVKIDIANNLSSKLVASNPELQWQEGYYRGYFELRLDHHSANASFFGLPTLLTRNSNEISLANFTVLAGANRLSRPVGGGTVENGALQTGNVVQINITNDTSVAGGKYFVLNQTGLEVL